MGHACIIFDTMTTQQALHIFVQSHEKCQTRWFIHEAQVHPNSACIHHQAMWFATSAYLSCPKLVTKCLSSNTQSGLSQDHACVSCRVSAWCPSLSQASQCPCTLFTETLTGPQRCRWAFYAEEDELLTWHHNLWHFFVHDLWFNKLAPCWSWVLSLHWWLGMMFNPTVDSSNVDCGLWTPAKLLRTASDVRCHQQIPRSYSCKVWLNWAKAVLQRAGLGVLHLVLLEATDGIMCSEAMTLAYPKDGTT